MLANAEGGQEEFEKLKEYAKDTQRGYPVDDKSERGSEIRHNSQNRRDSEAPKSYMPPNFFEDTEQNEFRRPR